MQNFLRIIKNILSCLLPLLIIGSSQAHAQSKHAHEHGKGTLEIIIDKNSAIGKLKMPLKRWSGSNAFPSQRPSKMP